MDKIKPVQVLLLGGIQQKFHQSLFCLLTLKALTAFNCGGNKVL